ncbi:MAG: flagellar hook-length control protein FliK [Pseudomonadota bacterium]
MRYLVDAAPMVGGGDHLGRSEADANVTTTTPAVGAIRSAEAGQIATILWRAESAPLVATGPKGEAPPAAVPGAPATPPNAATPSVLRVVCALSPTTALAVQVAAPEDESAVSILPVPVSAHAAAEAEPRPGFAAEERQAPRVEPIAAQPADAAALAASAAPAAKDMAATDIARPAPREAPVHPAVEQVVVHLHRAVAEGSDRITIKLVPAELGRIEIRIEIGPDGQVQAVFAADRPQTLELLQRDARQLERTLDSAGLRTDAGSLSFNLRGEGRTAVPVWTAESRHPGVELTPESPLEAAAPAIAIHARAAGIGERLDIRV